MSAVEYLPRLVDEQLAVAMASMPIVVVDGPRGVGKTTTAARIVESSVAFPRELPQIEVDPAGVLRSLEPPVLVDEWQLAGTDLLWTSARTCSKASSAREIVMSVGRWSQRRVARLPK